jgi:type II restriction enzyme
MREEIISLINSLVGVRAAFDELERQLSLLSKESLSTELLNCGIIPESINHDSSQEKLWAKYCDILLSLSLNYLNIQSIVIRSRGDSADILGTTESYSIVGDAKAFRLSRTAKNQKDFKVSALDDWRRQNTFACLVAPLYQYPTRNSQIYAQAKTKNVTLLSYVHLKFLLDFPPQDTLALLWNVPGTLVRNQDARVYWKAIDDAITHLTNQTDNQLRDYKQMEAEKTKEIAQEGINYWQSVIASYYTFSKEEAIEKLIRAEKIEQKIHIIQSSIQRADLGYE